MRAYYRFFGIASGIVMLLGGGAWVWLKTQTLPNPSNLRIAYIVFVFGGFLNATGDLWPALLAGINGVQIAQKILLGSALVNFLITGGGLLGNLGIWALVLGTIGSGLFMRWNGRTSFYRLAGSQLKDHSWLQFDLLAKLWPTAWRSGLVKLGGFLVISANTLICSGFLTLGTTASYGLSLSLTAMLTYASSTFTQVKLPLVNQMRASGKIGEIVELWIQRTRISLTFYILGATALLLAGNHGLQLIGAKTLLLPTGQLALALLIIGLEMHHVLYADLVISENRNPFVGPALISGLATVALSLTLTPRVGVWGMLLAQGIAQACFNNWWTIYRAIKGLGLSWTEYWRRYGETPIRI
jgi:O-antigen/teichoic acid export membrane protein